jgi:hypothetical protein
VAAISSSSSSSSSSNDGNGYSVRWVCDGCVGRGEHHTEAWRDGRALQKRRISAKVKDVQHAGRLCH